MGNNITISGKKRDTQLSPSISVRQLFAAAKHIFQNLTCTFCLVAIWI